MIELIHDKKTQPFFGSKIYFEQQKLGKECSCLCVKVDGNFDRVTILTRTQFQMVSVAISHKTKIKTKIKVVRSAFVEIKDLSRIG